MITDAQLSAAVRARDGLTASAAILPDLLARISGLMNTSWATGYVEVFDALGTRAAAMESQLGVLIGSYLVLGGSYSALPKPPVCYIKCATGDILATPAPFPAGGMIDEDTPLTRWSIPAADPAAAATLVADGDAAVLAALTAANG